MNVVHDSKNGISRLTDFTLAAICVYAGLFLDRCDREVGGGFIYVFIDKNAEAGKLEAEASVSDFQVSAKPFTEALKVVMVCQNRLRFAERDRKARED
jgi:hypothetical protein